MTQRNGDHLLRTIAANDDDDDGDDGDDDDDTTDEINNWSRTQQMFCVVHVFNQKN